MDPLKNIGLSPSNIKLRSIVSQYSYIMVFVVFKLTPFEMTTMCLRVNLNI
jgi:hypothetical protein